MKRPVILITGATRGIGFAAARQLAERGASVIVASRDPERAARAAMSVGGDARPLTLDITDEASISAAVDRVSGLHGRLDVLVNNSAVLLDHYADLLALDPDVLLRTFETNVVGTFRVTRAMLPLLKRSADPRVVLLSSGAGQLDGEPQAWAPAYSISKTALNMLTQQFTAAAPDVVFNSMCPGWCRTVMGGAEAPLSAEQGADSLVWLALDAPSTLRGAFIKQRTPIPW